MRRPDTRGVVAAIMVVLFALGLYAVAYVMDARAEGEDDSVRCGAHPRRYLDVYEVHTDNLICGVAQCGLRVQGFSCALVPVEEIEP